LSKCKPKLLVPWCAGVVQIDRRKKVGVSYKRLSSNTLARKRPKQRAHHKASSVAMLGRFGIPVMQPLDERFVCFSLFSVLILDRHWLSKRYELIEVNKRDLSSLSPFFL